MADIACAARATRSRSSAPSLDHVEPVAEQLAEHVLSSNRATEVRRETCDRQELQGDHAS